MIQDKSTDEQIATVETILDSLDRYDENKLNTLNINKTSIKIVLEFILSEINKKRNTTTTSVPVIAVAPTPIEVAHSIDPVEDALNTLQNASTDSQSADALIDSIVELFE